MTDYERAQLRIKCVEVFVMPASRHDIDKERVFELGKKLYQLAIEGLNETPHLTTAHQVKSDKQPSKTVS